MADKEAGEDEMMQAAPMAVSRVEAARRLGISLRSIDRALERGQLQAHKFGPRTLILIADIERYVEALTPWTPGRRKK